MTIWERSLYISGEKEMKKIPMDIDDELNNIIIRNNIDCYYPGWKKMLRAEKLIRQIPESYFDKRIVVVSTNKEDEDRFKVLLSNFDIVYLFAENENDNIYYLNSLDSLQNIDNDFYVIISSKGEYYLSKILSDKKKEFIRLNDYFEINGLHIEGNYYEIFDDLSEDFFQKGWGLKLNNNYTEYFCLKNAFFMSKNICEKTLYIKKMFFLAMFWRNFLLAEECIGEIEALEVEADDYFTAWEEFCELKNKIKAIIDNREEKAILMLWLDAIDYKEAIQLPFLRQVSENSYFFRNAFTPTPHTNPAMRAIMCGVKEIDDHGYRIDKINENNSKLYKTLKENKYDFQVVGNEFRNIDLKDCGSKYVGRYAPSTITLWETLRRLIIDDDSKKFIITHMNLEGHPPYFSVVDQLDFVEGRRERAMAELDRQVRYYSEFLGNKNIVKIYMSDHGDKDIVELIHVYLAITGGDIKNNKFDGLFSYINFHCLIEQIVVKGYIDESHIESSYIEVHERPVYNGNMAKRRLQSGYSFQKDWGYRGVVDKSNIYIKFNDGNECVVRNDENNIRYPEDYYRYTAYYDEKNIQPYRELFSGKEFPKVDKDKNVYSEIFLRGYRKSLKWNEKKMRIVCECLQGLPETNLGIRMGGKHTEYLEYILRDMGRKCDFIVIDNNKNCRVAKNHTVISIDEMSEYKIKTVVLSSFVYIEELREESKYYSNEIKVIDLYRLLEQNGIECKQDFYCYQIGDVTDEIRCIDDLQEK